MGETCIFKKLFCLLLRFTNKAENILISGTSFILFHCLFEKIAKKNNFDLSDRKYCKITK